MSAESLMNAALLAYAPLTAVVGIGSNAKIYPDFLSQEFIPPAVIMQRENTEHVNTIHTGASLASRVTMDAWCLAMTRIGAEQLADLVELALVAGEFLIVGRHPAFNEDTKT